MGKKFELTPHPEWITSLQEFVKPYWEKLLASPCVDGASKGKLSVEQMRGWIVQIYPFIHTFPKFLAESLIKVQDDYSRSFLIDNIRVEKEHAEHWVWMGLGFGIPKKTLFDLVEGERIVLRDVQSLTDWLWHVNAKGSLAEAVAATSFAIEGITGDISRKVVEGFVHYEGKPGVRIDSKTLNWMREHSKYDDDHPKIALEVVKRYAVTPDIQKRVMLAARRSIQLLDHALDASYKAYTPAKKKSADVSKERRGGPDRRKKEAAIKFPERRFSDRRGSEFSIVA